MNNEVNTVLYRKAGWTRERTRQISCMISEKLDVIVAWHPHHHRSIIVQGAVKRHLGGLCLDSAEITEVTEGSGRTLPFPNPFSDFKIVRKVS